jgi:hypothetical protein
LDDGSSLENDSESKKMDATTTTAFVNGTHGTSRGAADNRAADASGPGSSGFTTYERDREALKGKLF